MSRAIKFRAWDKKRQEMRSGHNLWLDTFDGSLHWQFGYDEPMPFLKEDIILMQFTGLHDKNGKEIWEGDIVREIPELSGHEDRKRRGIIEWDNSIASFVVKLLDRDDNAWCQLNEGNPNNSTMLKYTEVLGNLYESSELLK